MEIEVQYAGPQGAKGNDGDKGETGDTGPKITSAAFDGNNLVFTLDDSSTVTLTDAKLTLKGDQGDPGIGAAAAIQEEPSGTQNGTNKTFTLAHTPTGKVSVVFLGVEKQDTVDYSVSGTTLTLISFAPNASEGDTFWVNYYYEAT